MMKISNANSMSPLAFKGDTVNIAQRKTVDEPDSKEYKLRDIYVPSISDLPREETVNLEKEGNTLNFSFASTKRHNKAEQGRMMDAALSIAAQEAKGMGANKIAMDTDLFFMANKETIKDIPVKPAGEKVVIPEKYFNKLLKHTDASIRNNLSEAKDIYQTKTRFFPESKPMLNEEDLKKLFPNGTDNLKFSQGQIGDCYYLSAMKGLSASSKGADILAKIIEKKADDKFKVTFPGFPKESFEFDEKELRRSPSIKYGDPGVKILEHGFAKLKERLKWTWIPADPQMPKPGDKVGWLNAGFSEEGMNILSGAKMGKLDTVELNEGKGYPKTFEMYAKEKPEIKEEAKALLKHLKERGDNVAVCVETSINTPWVGFVAPDHAYAVSDINPEKEQITIVNPWYADKPRTFSYDEFFKKYATIKYVELDKSQPVE